MKPKLGLGGFVNHRFGKLEPGEESGGGAEGGGDVGGDGGVMGAEYSAEKWAGGEADAEGDAEVGHSLGAVLRGGDVGDVGLGGGDVAGREAVDDAGEVDEAEA